MVPAKVGRMIDLRGGCTSGSANRTHSEEALLFTASSMRKLPKIDLECMQPCGDREASRNNVDRLHVRTEPPDELLQPRQVGACDPEHGSLDRVVVMCREERATGIFPFCANKANRGDLAAAELSKDSIPKFEW